MSSTAPFRPRFHGRVPHADQRLCARPGCAELGEFKAPAQFEPDVVFGRSDTPPRYQWLCLDHVRDFNASYDAFRALTPEQRAAFQSGLADPAAMRAAWPFASAGGGFGRASDLHIDDPLQVFTNHPGLHRYAQRADVRNGSVLSAADSAALKVLSLAPDVSVRALKSRYKVLVRQFHPDSNGGDRSQEAQLRKVIDAYTRLMKSPAVGLAPKS